MSFDMRRAGERFVVCNSLAMAVVEGIGDHCCENMTGGAVWYAWALLAAMWQPYDWWPWLLA